MTPDQRLRRQFLYIADLPERPGGWDHDTTAHTNGLSRAAAGR